MYRLGFILITILLGSFAKAEYDYSFGGPQIYPSADGKYLIVENFQWRRVFDATTGKKVSFDSVRNMDESTNCPLEGYGLVEYRQIYQPNFIIDDVYLRIFDTNFGGSIDFPFKSVDTKVENSSAICDLDSNRIILFLTPNGVKWNVPQRKFHIFNGKTKAFEEYLLPEYYWDTVTIFDIAISDEQDLIAYFRSHRGGAGGTIDVRKFSTGKLLFTVNISKQDWPIAKFLKFTAQGRRLIFDGRIVFDSLSGRKVYVATKMNPNNRYSSVILPLSADRYLYFVRDKQDKCEGLYCVTFKFYIFDEKTGIEKLVQQISGSYLNNTNIYTYSLSNQKDSLAFITFYDVFTLNLSSGDIRKVPIPGFPHDFIMYSSDDQSLLYLNSMQDKIEKVSLH